ncbi:alcohol oxidase [Auriculariales sp. MPI-PUGE-AT-0066]|nr:alcohol oxidase [Auriculariales sp. MPI-PUGE-AT-0066]
MPVLVVPEGTRLLLVAGSLSVAVALPLIMSSFIKKQRAIFSSPTQVPGVVASSDNSESQSSGDYHYDYIVAGGGTTGCVLAARLSEQPNVRVLLLEAGQSGVKNLLTHIPAGPPLLFETPADWALSTVPQAHANERSLFWPRGRMLGGCSSMNAELFQYGSPSDFDEWARTSGSSEWSWDNFKQYLSKFERFVSHKDFQVDDSLRGQSGPMRTGFVGNFSMWAQSFIRSTNAVGVPIRKDFNTSEGTIGVGKSMSFINDNGTRCSTETAYLTPEVLARPNLTVLVDAQITRVVLEDDATKGKKAVGVEFASGSSRKLYTVRASREVIVACGSAHTPQILMLSGIGPAEHLKTVGVLVQRDLPGVGQNLLDHPSVNLRFRVPAKESIGKVALKGWKQIYAVPSLLQWLIFGNGPMLCNVGESFAFVRSDDQTYFPKSEYPEMLEDTTSGPGAPDIEMYASPLAWWDHARMPVVPVSHPESLCSLVAVLLRPTAMGSIMLKSSDPFESPLINPNYLGSEHDMVVLRRAIKLLSRIIQAGPLAQLLVEETEPLLDNNIHLASDAEIDRIIKERVETTYHPTSTARMAPESDGGVVDAELKVYGVAGLRIADASVLPTIPSGHPVAAIIAVAEKAADLILRDLK